MCARREQKKSCDLKIWMDDGCMWFSPRSFGCICILPLVDVCWQKLECGKSGDGHTQLTKDVKGEGIAVDLLHVLPEATVDAIWVVGSRPAPSTMAVILWQWREREEIKKGEKRIEIKQTTVQEM